MCCFEGDSSADATNNCYSERSEGAPGLKSVEEALTLRHKILYALKSQNGFPILVSDVPG